MQESNKKTTLASPMSYKTIGSMTFFEGVSWLEAVQSQTYPLESIYVLANDLMPDMIHDLTQTQTDLTHIEYVVLGNEPDERTKRRGKQRLYQRFADIRNMVLDYVLTLDIDYYVSVDTDVMIHPDCVSRLVQRMEDNPSYGMIGAIVNNTRRTGMNRKFPQATYNFGDIVYEGNRRKGNPESKCRPVRRFKRGTFFEVMYTGACTIMRMDMLRTHRDIRWGPHRSGEDIYLCQKIKDNGYKIGMDTSIVTLHKMDNTVWHDDVPAFEKGEFV